MILYIRQFWNKSTVEEKQVKRGVAFLNRNTPDWRKEINLQTLDVESGLNCPLAQIFGDYYGGLGRFHMPVKKAGRLGFSLGPASSMR